jgi:hypothetical protein
MVESMRHQPSLKQVATAAMIRLLEARGGRGDGVWLLESNVTLVPPSVAPR